MYCWHGAPKSIIDKGDRTKPRLCHLPYGKPTHWCRPSQQFHFGINESKVILPCILYHNLDVHLLHHNKSAWYLIWWSIGQFNGRIAWKQNQNMQRLNYTIHGGSRQYLRFPMLLLQHVCYNKILDIYRTPTYDIHFRYHYALVWITVVTGNSKWEISFGCHGWGRCTGTVSPSQVVETHVRIECPYISLAVSTLRIS